MSGPPDDKPERLLAGDATEFERRIMRHLSMRKLPRGERVLLSRIASRRLTH